MEQYPEHDETFAELAAAQLVEQVKNKKTGEFQIPIKDNSGEWIVTVKLIKKSQ
ncbi:hypothetical protein ACFPT7_21125 [Acidicapsa dinghuensis]|uniref:Uncharacterized protein n=1 Tax=Acidicapsa dinghuensis TaxID=2218256 RepID=A0ABW1ELM2_9BACT|nr:hypothetical protein [Acidicapsa dinghuensis]